LPVAVVAVFVGIVNVTDGGRKERLICRISKRNVVNVFVKKSLTIAPHVCCASYHRRWNQIVSVRKPSLWVFIKRIKDEEQKIRRDVRLIRSGQQRDVRRRKWRRLEERIVKLKREYAAGQISLEQYWNAMRFVVHAP
jgi:hypothetical protein